MINRWVILTTRSIEFYIIDSIIKDGSTAYIGHYDGERFIKIIYPSEIYSFGNKTRLAR